MHDQVRMFRAAEARRSRTGVSLHSHTLHSRESISSVRRVLMRAPVLRSLVLAGERSHQARYGAPLDIARGYWTPPVTPIEAHRIEAGRIEGLGLQPLVSLTDHDTIEAALSLHVLEPFRDLPISVEWTVPYAGTILHIGIHNLEPDVARESMRALAEYTAGSRGYTIAELLEAVTSDPATLVVLNHPFWDEMEIGRAAHASAAASFLYRFREWVHAVELNGLRPWGENAEGARLATEMRKPVVAGGDRHAHEPNALLNATNERTFAGFAREVRGGHSRVWVMPDYLRPFAVRIFENTQDVVGYQPDHGYGWHAWDDRVFYCCDDGVERPLSALWDGELDRNARLFCGLVRAIGHPKVRRAAGFAMRLTRGAA